jgi:Xaa-Pro aminopeptidase
MEYMDESSIAIIPTAPVQHRNRDINFPFRPDSNFFYLTGFAEAESVAVLMPGRSTGEYVLFCRERSLSEERWHGPLAGIDGARNDYNADDAFPYQDIDAIMLGLLESRQKIFYAMGINTEFDTRVMH